MWKRKRTLKEEYGTLGHFLRGDNACHYLGALYIEGTNFYFHREWRGVKDTAYAFARWLQTWGKMAGLIGRDPVRMIRAFWKYRWLSAYLATPMMVDKWIEGDRGMVLIVTIKIRGVSAAPTAASARTSGPSARSPSTTRCRSTSSTASPATTASTSSSTRRSWCRS